MDIIQGTSLYYVTKYDVGKEWEVCSTGTMSQIAISTRSVFITKEEAEAEAEMRNVQDRLLRKIAEIHAEEGWEVDWSDIKQLKYLFYYDYKEDDVVWSTFTHSRYIETVMSKRAKDYIDSLDLREKKLFLGIKN